MKHQKLAILLLLALAGISAIAQSYKLEPITIAGGGGRSTGGTYEAVGTIGQPAAGLLAGGTFTLSGGFWGAVLVESAGPRLSIQYPSAGMAAITWTLADGFSLQRNVDLNGTNWVSVAGSQSTTNAGRVTVLVPLLPQNQFFRLMKP